jgi:hypothetical protein
MERDLFFQLPSERAHPPTVPVMRLPTSVRPRTLSRVSGSVSLSEVSSLRRRSRCLRRIRGCWLTRRSLRLRRARFLRTPPMCSRTSTYVPGAEPRWLQGHDGGVTITVASTAFSTKSTISTSTAAHSEHLFVSSYCARPLCDHGIG